MGCDTSEGTFHGQWSEWFSLLSTISPGWVDTETQYTIRYYSYLHNQASHVVFLNPHDHSRPELPR